MSNISRFIESVVSGESQFSDILLEEGRHAVVNRPSGWEVSNFKPSSADWNLILTQIDGKWKEKLDNCQPIERTLLLGNIRARVSVFSLRAGEAKAISIRQLPPDPPKMCETGLPAFVDNFAKAQSGLLLVSGSTGSGKTTTISAMIRSINESTNKHIYTLEQPIEFIHYQISSVVTQREVGVDTVSFSEGIKESMRHSPDVIMVGEIRDRDTAEATIRAAESGHFVLATTHAKSAVGGIQKFLSLFGDEAASKAISLSHCFVGAIYQDLLPSFDETRYLLAHEIISGSDPQVANFIQDMSKLHALDEALQKNRLKNAVPLNACLKHMYDSKKLDRLVALSASNYPGDFDQMTRQG